MRIAQVAPLIESVPPKNYGGTERVVSYLTEELVRLGEEVFLFASGDSATQAKLIPCCKESLRTCRDCEDQLAHHFIMMNRVYDQFHEFDVVHWHIDYLHYPMSKMLDYTHITTLHGRLDIPELVPIYEQFPDIPLVSISNSQRQPVPHANFISTIYHGLPLELYDLNENPEHYLAFVGRISPEKRVDRAIEIAKMNGIPLKIAAKVDKKDQEYFDTEIRHLLDDPLLEFVGEIGESEKQEFMGNALALLFPIDWPEPFGLVMIEAMSCGTPVIAYDNGSVPEVIDDGVTGFIVNSQEEAGAAVRKIDTISRAGCRERFEKRFSSRVMAENYLNLYQSLIETNENQKFRKVIG
ncbi:MAG: glycosyltransferase family 4 protein [bacterium]|jgi:glycosyltransferase involved in cell wall biosynthesis